MNLILLILLILSHFMIIWSNHPTKCQCCQYIPTPLVSAALIGRGGLLLWMLLAKLGFRTNFSFTVYCEWCHQTAPILSSRHQHQTAPVIETVSIIYLKYLPLHHVCNKLLSSVRSLYKQLNFVDWPPEAWFVTFHLTTPILPTHWFDTISQWAGRLGGTIIMWLGGNYFK